MSWIIPLSLLILLEIVADILSKSWSLKGGWTLAVGALVSYLVANAFWLFALKNGSGLARGAVIFSVCTAIIATALGVFIYQENISSYQIVGTVLGIISLVLIFW